MTKEIQIKILGAKSQLDELHTSILSEPDDFQIERYGVEKGSTNLRFGIAEVAALVTIMRGAGALAKLIDRIFVSLKASRGSRFVIQTPFARVELVFHEDLTREEVASTMDKLVQTLK